MRRWPDRLLVLSTRGAAVAAASVLALVLGIVLVGAMPALARGGAGFLTGANWSPTTGSFGAWAMIAGSLATAGLALAIALPIGFGCGLASGWILTGAAASSLRALIMVLSGIPSVVLGLWGLTTLVPLIARWHAPGTSLLAAGLVLALMLVPTIALIVDATLRTVPAEQRVAAAALALGRWSTLRAIAGRACRDSLATGGVLAVARALGETMAVLLVAGNVAALPDGLFSPVRTLTGAMALEMAYATGEHRAALFVLAGIAVALVALVLVLLRASGLRPALGAAHA